MTTKWGINGWSESLRQELLPEVRVAPIEPGKLSEHAELTADDVAGVITFALSRPRHLASTRFCSDLPDSSETQRTSPEHDEGETA